MAIQIEKAAARTSLAGPRLPGTRFAKCGEGSSLRPNGARLVRLLPSRTSLARRLLFVVHHRCRYHRHPSLSPSSFVPVSALILPARSVAITRACGRCWTAADTCIPLRTPNRRRAIVQLPPITRLTVEHSPIGSSQTKEAPLTHTSRSPRSQQHPLRIPVLPRRPCSSATSSCSPPPPLPSSWRRAMATFHRAGSPAPRSPLRNRPAVAGPAPRSPRGPASARPSGPHPAAP